MTSRAWSKRAGGRVVERENLLTVLALVVGGTLLVVGGLAPSRGFRTPSGRALEAESWRRFWRPVVPAVLALAFLLGWALQEPDASDEAVRNPVMFAAGVFALLWLRAGVRALRALRPCRSVAAVATTGLFRPRVVLGETFADVVDPAALAAALAHEAAHVRHGDPLRIWLARVATDLQASLPGARARLRAWQQALEVARDEEARLAGADGADLAAAIIAAAQLGEHVHPSAVGLVGAGEVLRARVDRLLAPLVVPAEAPRSEGAGNIVWAALLVAACLLGVTYGDPIVRAFPWVAT
jgi:hypothetical protein